MLQLASFICASPRPMFTPHRTALLHGKRALGKTVLEQKWQERAQCALSSTKTVTCPAVCSWQIKTNIREQPEAGSLCCVLQLRMPKAPSATHPFQDASEQVFVQALTTAISAHSDKRFTFISIQKPYRASFLNVFSTTHIALCKRKALLLSSSSCFKPNDNFSTSSENEDARRGSCHTGRGLGTEAEHESGFYPKRDRAARTALLTYFPRFV